MRRRPEETNHRAGSDDFSVFRGDASARGGGNRGNGVRSRNRSRGRW